MDWRLTVKWLTRKLFEIVTLVLAIVAIMFAAIQYDDSRKQLDRSEQQLKNLTTITSSIQTHYVGEFPNNLDDVMNVITATSEGGSVDLMIDFASYAIYSRNTTFLSYIDALIKARQKRNVTIRMLVYDKELSKRAAETQFTRSDFETEKSGGFRHFFDEYPPRPASYEEFVTRMMELNDETVHDLCKNRIQIRRVPSSQKYVFFLWANNTPQAVFTFRNEVARTENRELSFKSSDPSLIQVFRIIFNQTWDAAAPLHDEDVACRSARLQIGDQSPRKPLPSK